MFYSRKILPMPHSILLSVLCGIRSMFAIQRKISEDKMKVVDAFLCCLLILGCLASISLGRIDFGALFLAGAAFEYANFWRRVKK
jgi:hypothetical protein